MIEGLNHIVVAYVLTKGLEVDLSWQASFESRREL